MSRTRTPKAIAIITGQADKHPERFNERVDPPVGAIGPAPKTLGPIERAAWNSFAIEMPWLCASDKWIVGLASRLSARTHEADCPIGIYAQLRLCLSSMGGTPADRSRVQWSTDDPDDDPASEFLN